MKSKNYIWRFIKKTNFKRKDSIRGMDSKSVGVQDACPT
jgi:hypothetical protein